MSTSLYSRALSRALALFLILTPAAALAQTGVSDNRVSLPEGPGSLEGVGDNVEIDPNMGSMRYSVSVRIPQGRNGMTPDLNLSYSSSSPTGELGVGWSMQLPTIERLTSRGIPDYDLDDQFAANGGSELVRVSQSADRQVYRERFEGSFVRYTWMSPGDGTQGYFIAEMPDGSVNYYGALEDGTLREDARSGDEDLGTAIYHLVERVDPYGNRVRYDYEQVGGERATLSGVSWVFVEGQAEYTASFSYEAREDVISDCGAGYEELIRRRLTGMRISHRDEIVREVALTYEDASLSQGVSRLARVEQWGVGGRANGLKSPLEFEFEYQRALGVACEGSDCALPQVVQIGALAGGGSLATGSATLIDINGDGLPDVLDTSQNSAHLFLINTLTPQTQNGQETFAQSFATSLESNVATGQSVRLSDRVQPFDVNGDGYTDLVDTNTGSFLLNDPDRADWLDPNNAGLDVNQLRQVDFGNARFFDYDNDKKIDVLVSVAGTTQVLRNDGSGFDYAPDVEPLGFGFADANLQLSDLNGDGMSDVVDLNSNSQFAYRINLGNGRWSELRTIALDEAITTSERDLVELEDLNGDGLDDVVIVTATQVKYALNRLDHFDGFETISASDLPDLPERTDGVRVLYADMNANGSSDVVWISSTGNVDYLEIFPERPNLLSRVDNGIGAIQEVTYGTAAEHHARALANSEDPRPLQITMAVVDRLDQYELLTAGPNGQGLHEVVEYTYREGFYDGVEKQYRGFERIELHREGNAAQLASTSKLFYELGDTDPYRSGLLLVSELYSDDTLINRRTTTYDSCPLDEIPTESALAADNQFPVRYTCQTAQRSELVEGKPDEAVTLLETMAYDGYGNVTELVRHGVEDMEGDELTTLTTFVPHTNRWMLRLPATEEVFDDPSGDRTEMHYYYDGADFVGAPLGEATHGFLSRQTTRASADEVIETLRQKRDGFGNSVETILPTGTLADDTTHRTRYTYDETGQFITRTVLAMGDYTLVRDSTHDLRHQRPVTLTSWAMGDASGTPTEELRAQRVTYDSLSRLSARYAFGDEEQSPVLSYEYDFGAPVSAITEHVRIEQNGPVAYTAVRCEDGLGRVVQVRTRDQSGEVFVDGFTSFNQRGNPVQVTQPYTSNSLDCERGLPAGVPTLYNIYDGSDRIVESTLPDATEFGGEPSLLRYEYAPLQTSTYDELDNDESSAFHDTPRIERYDGLMRLVQIERTSSQSSIDYTLHYDNTGSFSGYTDAAGNRHELSVDLAGRTTQITNPSFGTYTMRYTPSGQLAERVDPRGVTLRREYDAQDRLVRVFEPGKEDTTQITYTYDRAARGCEACEYMSGQLASVSYPLGEQFGQAIDTFGYDALDRQVLATRTFGELPTWQTRREFDMKQRVTSVTHPDGTVISREYDALDRLAAVPGHVTELRYAPNRELEHVTWKNLATLDVEYDTMRRPVRRTHTDGAGQTLRSTEYDYDRVGHVRQKRFFSQTHEQMLDGHTELYTYDALYRVTALNFDDEMPALGWQYDVLDRIVSQVQELADESGALDLGEYAYDESSPLRLLQAGTLDYAYDAMGSVTRRGSVEFGWDEHGRLSTVTRDDVGARHTAYDWDNGRVLRVGQDTVELFGFDGFEWRDGVASTYVKEGDVKWSRRTAPAPTLAGLVSEGAEELTAGQAWSKREDKDTFTLAQRLGAVANSMLDDEAYTVALHSDELTSVFAATDEGGEPMGQRVYWPTGQERVSQGDVDRYGFTAQEYDEVSGLIIFKRRQLDPLSGRWMSYDPKYLSPGAEQMSDFGEATTGYTYVSNNPANAYDPLGLGRNGNGAQSNQPSAPSNNQSSNKKKKSNDPDTIHIKIDKKKDYDQRAQTHYSSGTDRTREFLGEVKITITTQNNAPPTALQAKWAQDRKDFNRKKMKEGGKILAKVGLTVLAIVLLAIYGDDIYDAAKSAF